MRNHRNPRYAPEYLERKLSPSALLCGLTTTALVDTTPTLPPTTLPPIVQPPIVPYGPTVPA